MIVRKETKIQKMGKTYRKKRRDKRERDRKKEQVLFAPTSKRLRKIQKPGKVIQSIRTERDRKRQKERNKDLLHVLQVSVLEISTSNFKFDALMFQVPFGV